MSLFGLLREAFEREARALTPPPVTVPVPRVFDPVTRVSAQAFLQGVTLASDVSHEEAVARLSQLSVHSLALLDSPAGWIALAQTMGLSPRVTVH